MLGIVARGQQYSKQPEKHLPNNYAKTVESLFGFFDEHAFDSTSMVYYSEVDNNGSVVSDKIYTVALSRMIYGLSYTSKFYPDNLIKAKKSIEFQLNNLIGTDSIGAYSISYVDKGKASEAIQLDIWQQAYGLCGLTEFYRNNPDDDLLSTIHKLHDAFVTRFYDIRSGGFYGAYDLKVGQVSGSKSLQSLVYPITAYMANLWGVDSLHREKYEPMLAECLEILHKAGWNKQTNWVNLKFDDLWNVLESADDDNSNVPVFPGHNFQLASLFLRTKSWDFLSNDRKEEYANMAHQILDATFQKSIFEKGKVRNGIYSQVDSETDEVLDTRKTWWQHCEAVLALSLCEDNYQEEKKQLEEFFFSSFPDFENGGEYFYLDKNDKPITNELKGSIGKSAYHTIEMIRFLMQE
nr:AGE family epimerase/isomerase [uncultured Draconibacterium sp.]